MTILDCDGLYLAVGESVQHPACLDALAHEIGLLEASNGGSCNDIFIERKWNENNGNKKIDNGADGAHRFGSGPIINICLLESENIEVSDTYMVIFLVLLISTPFSPAFMNVSPSHRIRLYANANAMPLNANEAISGSPLPRKLLNKIATEAAESERRLHVSTLERVVAMMLYMEDMMLNKQEFRELTLEDRFLEWRQKRK